MRTPLILLAVLAAALLPLRDSVAAIPVEFSKPGSVQEQHNEIPAADVPLAAIWKDLESDEVAKKEGALLWLLRQDHAGDVGYLAFPKKSVRFGVDRVRTLTVGEIAWRLVECTYLSGVFEAHGGMELRHSARVAYLFDNLGHLRDWQENCTVLSFGDCNQDGKVELLVTTNYQRVFGLHPDTNEKPVDVVDYQRVVMVSYERGRAREILRVDGLSAGPDVTVSLPPVEGGTPQTVVIAGHGTYEWDEIAKQYFPTRSQGNKKE